MAVSVSPEMTNSIVKKRIEPQSGTALEVAAGQLVRITDPRGEQVSDMISFARADTSEWLSSGRTIDYANTIYLTTGHVLYSNRSRPMWTIVEDKVGMHDFLLTPCSPDTFRIIYGTTEYHPSCLENLSNALAPYGVEPDMIPTTFNIFMNVVVNSSGQIDIRPPSSKAGDFILLRAEMDMVVGITACSAELSNNGSFKPIDVELLDSK
jgi:uncharacterized protein YcgI (DUF1989 family)